MTISRRRRKDPRWAVAKWAFEQAFPGVEVGRVHALGEGLYRKAYLTDIESKDDRAGRYVALVAHKDPGPEFASRARREAGLLRYLAGLDLPFRISEIAALVQGREQPILVERFVAGMELDYRERGHSLQPWRLVGKLASSIHSIDAQPIRAQLPGFETRRAHELDHLSVFEGLDDPIAQDVYAWALENLPPETPASLLHGDLLGQNVLCPTWEPSEGLGVIDWEFAQIGDRGYDLAIVTRGGRRPFQLSDSLSRLLESYNEGAHQDEISASAVHIHELCLVAAWYRDTQGEPGRAAQAEQYLNQLRGVFRRATAAPRSVDP